MNLAQEGKELKNSKTESSKDEKEEVPVRRREGGDASELGREQRHFWRTPGITAYSGISPPPPPPSSHVFSFSVPVI